MGSTVDHKATLFNLPPIDIRACVFADTDALRSSSLLSEITDRIVATGMICSETLHLDVTGTDIDWSTINKDGVMIQLQTGSGNKVPLLVRWDALENIKTMSRYVKELVTALQH